MIKSNLTNAYMMFVMDLADLSACDHKAIDKATGGKLSEIFASQHGHDKFKKKLDIHYKPAIAVYFNSFNGPDGLNYLRLEHEIKKNRKFMDRYLGPDKVKYLLLIIQLMSVASDGQPKKGLLFAVGS